MTSAAFVVLASAPFFAAALSGPILESPKQPWPSQQRRLALFAGLRRSADAASSSSSKNSGSKRGSVHQKSGLHGVRDGDSNSEPAADGMPDGSQQFRFLDNLEPVAPMDSVSPPGSVTTLGLEPMPGEHHNSVFVPPYRNPDPFPTTLGHHCHCTLPKPVEVTSEQKDWARSVAKQLGIRVKELPRPMSPEGRMKCTCSGDGHALWTRWEPVPNSRNFTLESADITFPAGNYWSPSLKGGLAAPEDKLPLEQYPLQAPSDRITILPGVAQEDRVPLKYTRYMDQVSARSESCEGDGVSQRCTTECFPGDVVEAHLGSMRLDARIVSTHEASSAVIEYIPSAAQHATDTVECPLEAGCTSFRVCRQAGSWCVQQETEHPRDFLGNLHLKMSCPPETQVCRAIQQLVGGKFLRKGDRLIVLLM